MDTKEIVIRLLHDDMKYYRMMSAMYKNESIPKEYQLNIMKTVSLVMNTQLSDEWIECYMNYIHEAIDNPTASIELLAEKCYVALQKKELSNG